MRYIIRAVVFLLAIPSFVAAQGLYTETQAKRGKLPSTGTVPSVIRSTPRRPWPSR